MCWNPQTYQNSIIKAQFSQKKNSAKDFRTVKHKTRVQFDIKLNNLIPPYFTSKYNTSLGYLWVSIDTSQDPTYVAKTRLIRRDWTGLNSRPLAIRTRPPSASWIVVQSKDISVLKKETNCLMGVRMNEGKHKDLFK